MCSKQTYPKIILKKGNYDIRQKKKRKKKEPQHSSPTNVFDISSFISFALLTLKSEDRVKIRIYYY